MGIGGYVVVMQRFYSDAYGLGQGRNLGCRSSLRPRGGGMERCACNTRGQSQRRPRRDPGLRQLSGRARGASGMLTPLPVDRPGRGYVRRAARSDESEQLAGRGDLGDVAAAAGLDPFAIKGDFGGVGLALDGFGGPPIAPVCCPAC